MSKSRFTKQEKRLALRLREAVAYLRQVEDEVDEQAGLIALGNKASFVAEELEDLVKQYRRQEKRVEKLERRWQALWLANRSAVKSGSDAAVC